VRSRTLIETSCLSRHAPSYNEVIALTDSSNASLLFFYDPSFDTQGNSCSSVVTYLAECRSCDLSVPLPLVKLCRYDITPEKLENLVGLQRLGESLVRAQHDLYDVGSPNSNRRLAVSHNSAREATMIPADLNCVGISDVVATPWRRPQGNLSTDWAYGLDLRKS
jgi:hypothetical protein